MKLAVGDLVRIKSREELEPHIEDGIHTSGLDVVESMYDYMGTTSIVYYVDESDNTCTLQSSEWWWAEEMLELLGTPEKIAHLEDKVKELLKEIEVLKGGMNNEV